MSNEVYCQSCGMPLTEEAMYGKNADGTKNEDYCCYCYPSGAFASPNETMEEMIESCIPYLVEDGTCPDADSARELLQGHLPTLKRWKAA